MELLAVYEEKDSAVDAAVKVTDPKLMTYI